MHLRGTGYFIGRTLYLVDGVPVTPFLSTTVNPNDIEKVEVLLGPSSALYGANAMGGVINLITKKGTKDTGFKVDMGYGSRNTFRPHAEIGNKMGNFHYYLSYSGDYSGGYKMNPFDNVARDIPQFMATVSSEQLVMWNPDVITISTSAKYNPKDVYKSPHLKNINAVKNKRVFKHPYHIAGLFTPRVPLLLAWHAAKFYPELGIDWLKITEDFF